MARNGITQIRNFSGVAGEAAPSVATVQASGYAVPKVASGLLLYANAITTTGAPTSLNIDVWVLSAAVVYKAKTISVTIGSGNAGATDPVQLTNLPYDAIVYPTVSFVGGTSPTATLRVGVQPTG